MSFPCERDRTGSRIRNVGPAILSGPTSHTRAQTGRVPPGAQNLTTLSGARVAAMDRREITPTAFSRVSRKEAVSPHAAEARAPRAAGTY